LLHNHGILLAPDWKISIGHPSQFGVFARSKPCGTPSGFITLFHRFPRMRCTTLGS
jgi:hypothetical protein